MKMPRIGAQLYTVREFCKTVEGVRETLRKVARIGYTEVQVSGFGPVAPADVARAADDAGLRIVATHVGWPRFLNELDRVIEEHRLWRCPHPAIGGLPAEYYAEGGLRRFLAELGPIAARLKAAEMDFSYHNHNHELARCGEKTWLEQLYEGAPADMLKAELDVYWVQAGGGDPAAWIRKYAGREPLLHLKDMTMDAERKQRFAEIGQGNLNWPAIFRAAEEGGVEHLLVEQDNCYGRDPFESLAISYRFLRSHGYA
jgi:sugar phosphate isomerase/epimerase